MMMKPRGRNPKMDAFMKLVHTSDKFAFESVCREVGGAMPRGMKQFVRCPHCGQPHVAVSAADARRSVSRFNAASERGQWGQVTTFERYLRCFKCGADSGQFVPTVLSQWEHGQTIQTCVVEREG